MIGLQGLATIAAALVPITMVVVGVVANNCDDGNNNNSSDK